MFNVDNRLCFDQMFPEPDETLCPTWMGGGHFYCYLKVLTNRKSHGEHHCQQNQNRSVTASRPLSQKKQWCVQDLADVSDGSVSAVSSYLPYITIDLLFFSHHALCRRLLLCAVPWWQCVLTSSSSSSSFPWSFISPISSLSPVGSEQKRLKVSLHFHDYDVGLLIQISTIPSSSCQCLTLTMWLWMKIILGPDGCRTSGGKTSVFTSVATLMLEHYRLTEQTCVQTADPDPGPRSVWSERECPWLVRF